jgi:Uma2 family endonuclease
MSKTVELLYRTASKAEIVYEEVIRLPPSGRMPGYAVDSVLVSLKLFGQRVSLRGIAVGDNKAFLVNLPNRESFSPDAAYYEGPNSGMRFFEGAPLFAVEVRSEGDYGPSAEREMAAKRAEYFQAETQVIWDVDLLSEDVVRVYRHGDADTPSAVYRRGQNAEAKPTVAGWTMPVDDLFE